MKPKHAALTATIVVLLIAGYCTLIALSPKETAIKILIGTALVAAAFVVWIVVFVFAVKGSNDNLND